MGCITDPRRDVHAQERQGKADNHTVVQKVHGYPRTMGKEMKGTGAPAQWEGQKLYITPAGAALETQVRVLNSK